ncbi:IclR family transcriptional regulator [Thalassospiraceae bacterium LMO-JJ14]|nr:IclR family transcriptional regulator [Thalassospiraceae bacterium LMO-JJ14]
MTSEKPKFVAPDPVTSNALFVGSLEKGFRVLAAFSDDFPALGVTEIALRTGLDKSAAQRFSNTLHQLGFLEKDAATRRYRPGRRLMELAYTYLRHSVLGAVAMPRLIEAGSTYQTTVNLAEREDTSVIYTVRIPHVKAAYSATVPGRRVPIFCSASGIAMMSRMDDDEAYGILARSDLVKRLATTLIDPDKIMKVVAQTRKRGFAMTYAQQLPREISIAAPIVDVRGRPVGAVQIPVYTPAWKQSVAAEKLGPLSIETADGISGALVASEQEY